MDSELQNYSHKRYNVLTGEWVLVSPQRSKRPWLGQEEIQNNRQEIAYEKDCYLCAGNKRINGAINPKYKDIFVFKNDFSALQNNGDSFFVDGELFKAKIEHGICKVICFSPDHSQSIADMKVSEIKKVIQTWQQEYISLGKEKNINYVQIFENKGAIMGCSNPHPHGQIWAQSSLPNEVLKKDKQQFDYYKSHHKTLLGDYIQQELIKQERIIFDNEAFVVLTPFWAIWPFEVMIIPKNPQKDISNLSRKEVALFAETLSIITKIYNKIFNIPFPYSSGIHQAPTNGKENKYWHWHLSFYPPLLRSATIKKFMVGYEMFGSPQRDITPEKACKILKEIALNHLKINNKYKIKNIVKR